MQSLPRTIHFLLWCLRASVSPRLLLALFCVCATHRVISLTAVGQQGGQQGGKQDGQQPASASTASTDLTGTLEQARALQAEADRQLDAKQFRDALEKTERALAIRRRLLGAMHADVAYSTSRLGTIAYSQGQYERAEALMSEALRIRRATLGPNHLDVAESLNDLASILLVRGEYVRPEPLYQEALGIYERSLARAASPPAVEMEAQTLMGDLLDNLGRLYYTRGDYSRSESSYLRALALREKRGSDDPGVAETLARIGGVYYSSGQYDKAVKVLQQALAIQQRRLPPNHPSLAASSFNLAAVYFNQGNYPAAERLFQRALAIDEEALDPQHPRLATRLLGLAEVLRLEGEYARADPLYERALTIREKSLGPAHPDVATTLFARSLLRHAAGEPDVGIELMSRAADLREQTLALVLTTGSEEQKRLFLRTLVDETDIAVSLHLGAARRSPAAARLALTNILQRKGRSIDAIADELVSLRRHLDDRGRDLLDRLAQSRSRLATIALRGVATDEQRRAVSDLAGEIEQLEQSISVLSSEFRAAARRVTLEGIQAALPAGAALIEFFSYRPFSIRNAHDTVFGPPRYAAYVLRRDGITASVDLGEAAPIDREVRRFRTALSVPAGEVRRAARTLYDAVMAPVRGSLSDGEHIIIAPDGALNLIPFSALVEERGHYLIEDFTISYVTSGRDLTRLPDSGLDAPRAGTPAVIVANPSFNGPRIVSRPATKTAAARRAFDAHDFEQQLRFAALPGTAQEAAALATLLPGATLLTGAEATEARLKKLRGPSILHIATHGFFLQPRQVPERRGSLSGVSAASPQAGPAMDRQDGLLRSGLALAGANQRASGDTDDGLLTALEVAGLDLWGTRMVVLSACDTGLGDTRNGEGVYGLRRALVLAGSESQVMSLWQVSDVATRELMIAYYQRLRSHEGRAEGLRNVQLAMLRGQGNRVHPFYWASFIESGDWRRLFD
jgi:CHAT domain-containing protein/Tfp pilus assembly protein PilF